MLDRSKAVSESEFWADRIEKAKTVGNIRHAIYEAPERIWQGIKNDHLKILDRHIGIRDKVLDAGCGYGRAFELVKASPKFGGSYTGVDLSEDFIKIAKESYPEGNFIHGNLKQLPFEDGQFDIVFCISVMIMVVQNLGWFEWEDIQNELLRVSKRGILCLEYGITDTKTTSDTFYVVTKK